MWWVAAGMLSRVRGSDARCNLACLYKSIIRERVIWGFIGRGDSGITGVVRIICGITLINYPFCRKWIKICNYLLCFVKLTGILCSVRGPLSRIPRNAVLSKIDTHVGLNGAMFVKVTAVLNVHTQGGEYTVLILLLGLNWNFYTLYNYSRPPEDIFNQQTREM